MLKHKRRGTSALLRPSSAVPRAGRGRPFASPRSVAEVLESRLLLSTVVVNTTIDGLFPPSTGVVSLRNAIATANSSPTPTTISFDPNVFATPRTIMLNGNGLALSGSEPVTIMGPAAVLTVNGNALGSVLQIDSGNTTSLSHVTITNGSGGGGTGSPGLGGGGIYVGGTATLTDVIVTGNTATPV